MHPNKFFKETNLRTGIDTFEIFDNDLKNKLSELHPKNFIKTKVTLPVYKVIMSYKTDKGNYKEAEKYMIMDNPTDGEECYEDCWADMLSRDYCDEHGMDDVNILEVQHICDAVLPIG